jgi:hypothetical protein
MARDEKLDPPVTGQYLCAPVVLHPTVVPEKYRKEYRSREGAKSDPVLTLGEGGEKTFSERGFPAVNRYPPIFILPTI